LIVETDDGVHAGLTNEKSRKEGGKKKKMIEQGRQTIYTQGKLQLCSMLGCKPSKQVVVEV
jgi:hypothetical protein